MQSCFTGVESTPKIDYKEDKGQKNSTSAEEEMAATFKVEPFSRWENGKAFYVTSPRISLALTGISPQTDMPASGDTIIYTGRRTVTDLTGDEIVELQFTMPRTGSELAYRTNSTVSTLTGRNLLEVPFTIDLTLVDNVRQTLKGKELFVKTNLWFTPAGNSVNGRKFVKVAVTDVIPGNEVYPLKVIFTDDKDVSRALYMSAATGSRWTPREFQSLFSFTNPRQNYPQITDAIWHNIINSKVAKGMTKLEATLAIGSPSSIDRGHDHSSAYERWGYSDGIYLIFEDGLLTRHNQ